MPTKAEQIAEVMVSFLDCPKDQYLTLATVFASALLQAAEGKGKDRHAQEGQRYEDQLVMQIQGMLGESCGPGTAAYQVVKKTIEALRLNKDGRKEMSLNEILGSINYQAAVYLSVKES